MVNILNKKDKRFYYMIKIQASLVPQIASYQNLVCCLITYFSCMSYILTVFNYTVGMMTMVKIFTQVDQKNYR